MSFTPTLRQRELLRTHALINADLAYDDIEDRGDAPVGACGWWYLFDRLPSSTFRETIGWRRQMARSFHDVAEDLGHGGVVAPRTLAEYAAVLISIEDAFQAYVSADYDEKVACLPSDVNDFDWASLTESVILDPELGTRGICSLVDFLPADAWFQVSSGTPVRDPDRGFDRS